MIIHPLESLSASEIATAVKLFRENRADEQAFFSSIGLKEPNKLDVLNETNIPRIVTLTGLDQKSDGGFVCSIDVTEKKVLTTTRLPLSALVAYNSADFGIAIMLTKSNKQWREAVAARGVDVTTDGALALIQVDPWPAGGYAHDSVPKGHRAPPRRRAELHAPRLAAREQRLKYWRGVPSLAGVAWLADCPRAASSRFGLRPRAAVAPFDHERHIQLRGPLHSGFDDGYQLVGWLKLEYQVAGALKETRRELALKTGIAKNIYTLNDGTKIIQEVFASTPDDLVREIEQAGYKGKVVVGRDLDVY